MSIKNTIKILICQVFYYTGILHLLIRIARSRRRCGPVIVIDFHSVVADSEGSVYPEPSVNLPVEDFRRILDFLTRYFKIVSLDEVVEALEAGGMFARPVVALTVDDGFRDNYELLFPVLKEKGLPATIFLTAGLIATPERIWVDRILEAVAGTKNETIRVSRSAVGEERVFPIKSLRQKQDAAVELLEWLKTLPVAERQARQKDIEDQLGYRPAGEPLMLNWEQIREMEKQGITFGAHTMTHPILSRMPHEEAAREIRESKALIERELGHPVRHFAFPNGGRDDFTPELGDYCRELGFNSVSSTVPGTNGRSDDRWFLKRLCPCLPVSVFAASLWWQVCRGNAPGKKVRNNDF